MKRYVVTGAMGICVAVWGGTSSPAAGDDVPPSLDELLNIESAQPDSSPPEVEVTDTVRRRLEGQSASGALENAVLQMEQVAVRLGQRFDTGIETQRLQEQILARLDRVIAAARRQQGSGSGSAGSSGTSARQQDSGGEQISSPESADGGAASGQEAAAGSAGGENSGQSSAGSVGEVEPDDGRMHQQRTEWGNLPPRLRDELSQGLKEQFSPMYRQLTEAYYQKLAETAAEPLSDPGTMEP